MNVTLEMSRQVQVNDPILNRGTNNPNHGLSQPSFGLGHNLSAFPRDAFSWQAPPSSYTMGRSTQPLRFRHEAGDYQRNYDQGSLIFVHNQQHVMVNRISDLPTVRYSANVARDSANEAANTRGREASAPAQPSAMGLRRQLEGGADAYTALATMESFADTVTFAGIAFGPPEPFFQNSAYKSDYGPVGTEVMTLALVNQGHCWMPNFFGCLRPGQHLFMLSKPMARDENTVNYYDPFSNPRAFLKRLRMTASGEVVKSAQPTYSLDADLSIDFEFFASTKAQPPCAIDNPALLCANMNADENTALVQPSRNSRFYYERTEGGDIEVKEGMVWYLGKNIYGETELNTAGKVDTMRKRFATNDHGKISKMEIVLDCRREF